MNKKRVKNRFLILYGSQTGKSKAIAEEIADNSAYFGLTADLYCLSWTERKFSINQESCVVFVVSTTGDGEPPDTALKFYRRIRKCTLDNNYLNGLHYTLLALGDSNYPTFCYFGKQLDKRLQELSAKRFYPVGYGDEAFGTETVADPWINRLWPALRKHLNVDTAWILGPALRKHLNVDTELTQTRDHFFIDKDTKFQKASDLVLESVVETIAKANNNCPSDNSILNSSMKKSSVSKNTVNANGISDEINNISIYSLPCARDVMNSKNLRIPPLPEPYLLVSFGDGKSDKAEELLLMQSRNLISSALPLFETQLVCAKRLACNADVKESLELTFRLQCEKSEEVKYKPGDSFGFLCPNPQDEVNALLERLGVLGYADVPCSISVKEEHCNKKKTVAHLPASCTLRFIFSSLCEIRSVPKKVLLRVLSEYTSDDIEKLCLKFLCSQEGSSFYSECIRKPSLCLLDVLCAYKSCKPPVERILEYLPVLKSRFYSVTSSPLVDPSVFRIVFNVIEISEGEGRCKARKGVCTGWLSKISHNYLSKSSDNLDLGIYRIDTGLSLLSLDSEIQEKLLVYKRQNPHFFLPDNPETPIIMVGPGTGVAPFVGFLQHRELLMKSARDTTFGESWLFFGCRYKDKDFLYREELNTFVTSKVLTNLRVSFSRDQAESSIEFCPRYVQDNIKHHAKEIYNVIDSGGIIYVCGDAKNMAHDVRQAFIDVVQISKNVSIEEARAFMSCLESEKRYVTDVWA